MVNPQTIRSRLEESPLRMTRKRDSIVNVLLTLDRPASAEELRVRAELPKRPRDHLSVGGPIAAVEDGDRISFDLLAGTIHWQVSDDAIAERLSQWQKRELPDDTDPYLKRYAALVDQASRGCVLNA